MLLCRAVASEIKQRGSEEETKIAWNVQLKQAMASMKEEAKKDVDSMNASFSHRGKKDRSSGSTRTPTLIPQPSHSSDESDEQSSRSSCEPKNKKSRKVWCQKGSKKSYVTFSWALPRLVGAPLLAI